MDARLDLLIMAVPLFGALMVPLVGLLGESAKKWFAVLVSAITAGLVFYLIPGVWNGDGKFWVDGALGGSYQWISQLGIGFDTYIDPLAIVMAAIASGIGALVVIYSTKYMQGQGGLGRYYVLVLIFIGSMIGLVVAESLLVVYIFWELVGLCSYSLIGFYHKDQKAARAGMKAFVMTRIGDVGLFIAIMALYLHAGTFSIHALADLVANQPDSYWVIPTKYIDFNVLYIAAFGVLLGAAGKSAQVPLHTWLPDAMEAPTTISALIHAATMVNAGVYIIARTMPLFAGVPGWTDAILWVGAITAILAASLALVEPDLKRVLAYSTVSQLGFMFFALGMGPEGVVPAMYHLLNHAIFKALLFLGAGAVIHSVGTRNMYEMGGLAKTMKITMIAMGVGTLALVGIPPLSGFWSKDLILHEAWVTEHYVALAVVSLAAVFTMVYSFKMFFLVFLGRPRADKHGHEAPVAMWLPLVLLAFGSLVSWLAISAYTEGLEAYGFAHVEHLALLEFAKETFLSIPFAITVVILVIGLVLFFLRWTLGNLLKGPLSFAYNFMRDGYGFDWLYDQYVKGLRHVAWGGKRTQTGDANYNAAGIVIALAILIAVFCLYGGVF